MARDRDPHGQVFVRGVAERQTESKDLRLLFSAKRGHFPEPHYFAAAVFSAPIAFNRICASRHVEVGMESTSFGFSILR